MPTHVVENSAGYVPMSKMGANSQPLGAILAVLLDDTGARRQSWTQPLLDANGVLLMSALPKDLTTALVALVEEQKQTNELLFELIRTLTESKELTNVS